MTANVSKRARDKWNHPCPGGESLAMVARRAQAFLDALDRDTVAVSHGTFGRVLRAVYAGAGERGMDGLDEPQDCIFRLSGGEIARIGPAGR